MSLVACTFIGDPPQLDPDKAARIRVLISDFGSRKEKRGESFVTETMMAHGYPWALYIYPRGAISSGSDADAEWVSCYLIYDSDARDRKEFPVDAKATIRSNNSQAVNISMGTFDGEHPAYGIRNWLQRNDACKEEVLTIDVDICVNKNRKSIWYPTKALKDSTDSKLRKLYSSSESTDVTFIVGSTRKQLYAHKCILEMSSPYLYGLVLSKAEEIDGVDTAVEATCETAEQNKSEQEGISSDGFVPVSSAEDDDKEDNEDAPAQSTNNRSSSRSSSAPCQPFGTASTSATSCTASNEIKSTTAPPFVFGGGGFSFGGGGGGGSTSMTKTPSPFSIFLTSNKKLVGIPSSTPSNFGEGGFYFGGGGGGGSTSMTKTPSPFSIFSTSNKKLVGIPSSTPSNFGEGGFHFGGGGGGGSTSMTKAPSPFSIFSTSNKKLAGIPSSTPSNVNIELPGVNEVAFGALLKFLYTGIEPNYIRGDEKSAKDMLVLADQCDCTHLKLYAESVLAERFLDTSNDADMIQFAHAHSCALLKEAAMSMYTTYSETVMLSEGYSRLTESNNLLRELLKYATGKREKYIRVADRTLEEDVDNLDVASIRERLQSVNIDDVDGSKGMLVKRWKETIA